MIRLLLLTAAIDLTGAPWDGIAAPLFDDDTGLSATGLAIWSVAIGFGCMAMALRRNGAAGTRRLSMGRTLA